MNTRPVLVTGFEPFAGGSINPSGEIARALDGRLIAGQTVVGAVLPCSFRAAPRELRRLLARHRPILVVCTGQAGGRTGITPERVALNVIDSRIPDNEGVRPVDRAVVRGGPVAYWTRLPIKAITAALRRRNIPAGVSQTAGTFVCNQVFYALMHRLRQTPQVRAGFIHVPHLPGQAGSGEPSLPLATVVDGMARAVEVALTVRRDRHEAGGRLA